MKNQSETPNTNVPRNSPLDPLGDRGQGDRTWTPEEGEQGISNRPDDEPVHDDATADGDEAVDDDEAADDDDEFEGDDEAVDDEDADDDEEGNEEADDDNKTGS